MPYYLNIDHTPADLWSRAFRRAHPYIIDAIERMPDGFERYSAIRTVTDAVPMWLSAKKVGTPDAEISFAVSESAPTIVTIPLSYIGIDWDHDAERLVYIPEPILDDDLDPA